jgi:hypothetical protein
MKRNHIVAILVVIAVIGIILAFSIFSGGGTRTEEVVESAIPVDDPIDVTTQYFDDWIAVRQGTTTDETIESLLASPRISDELRAKLTATQNDTPDPVLCQTEIPSRIGAKPLFTEDRSAQVMMLARGLELKSPFQSVVTLAAVDGQWQMTDIVCSQGDVAPIKDFDFEREGFLLKSVPPPLNPDFWHLVYEENGQMGRTVPLTINAESICVQPNGTESPCDESSFRDATKVFLRADMSEVGATVRRLEF